MRRTFASELVKQAEKDKDIWLIAADLGKGMFDEFKAKFPDRYINTGAAEQAASDIAVGLALSGKKPFLYSITPFIIFRCFETLRTYIDHEKIPVRLVGSGRDRDYERDGYSHWSEDAKDILDTLSNIKQLWPSNKEDVKNMVKKLVKDNNPFFISLRR